jgi:hypothetical protein
LIKSIGKVPNLSALESILLIISGGTWCHILSEGIQKRINLKVFKREKNGNQIDLIPIFRFNICVSKKFSLLCLHMALGVSGWTSRFVGLLCFIMATLAGFVKSILFVESRVPKSS